MANKKTSVPSIRLIEPKDTKKIAKVIRKVLMDRANAFKNFV